MTGGTTTGGGVAAGRCGRRRRRRGRRRRSSHGRRHTARTREDARDVQAAVGLDDDSRIGFERDDAIDAEAIRILLECDAEHVEALPIDEILAQTIIDRVQILETHARRHEHAWFYLAVGDLGGRAQAPVEQAHRGPLIDVRLQRLEFESRQLELEIGR